MDWQEALKRVINTPGEDSPIVGFNDDKRVVEVEDGVESSTVKEIERILNQLRVDYEVKEVQLG